MTTKTANNDNPWAAVGQAALSGAPYGAGLAALVALSHQLGYLSRRNRTFNKQQNPAKKTDRSRVVVNLGEKPAQETPFLERAAATGTKYVAPAAGFGAGYFLTRELYKALASKQLNRDEDDARQDYVRALLQSKAALELELADKQAQAGKPAPSLGGGPPSSASRLMENLAGGHLTLAALTALLSAGATGMAVNNHIERNRPRPEMPKVTDFILSRPKPEAQDKDKDKQASDAPDITERTARTLAAAVLVRADQQRTTPLASKSAGVRKAATDAQLELTRLHQLTDSQLYDKLAAAPALCDSLIVSYIHARNPELSYESDLTRLTGTGLKLAWDSMVAYHGMDKQAQQAPPQWGAAGIPGMTPQQFYALFTQGDPATQQQTLQFLHASGSPLQQVAARIQAGQLDPQQFQQILQSSQNPASRLQPRQGTLPPGVRPSAPAAQPELVPATEGNGDTSAVGGVDGGTAARNDTANGMTRAGVPTPQTMTLTRNTKSPVGGRTGAGTPDALHANFAQQLAGTKSAAPLLKPAITHAILFKLMDQAEAGRGQRNGAISDEQGRTVLMDVLRDMDNQETDTDDNTAPALT